MRILGGVGILILTGGFFVVVRCFAGEVVDAPDLQFSIPKVLHKTKDAGGGRGERYIDLAPENARLAGFAVHRGTYDEHPVIGSVQPIYATVEGQVRGARHGAAKGDELVVEARAGYAVGAVKARGGNVVDGFQIIFMKVKDGGNALDPADSYASEWLGGPGGAAEDTLGGDGSPIVGIFGKSDTRLASLGLLQSALPGREMPKDPAAEGSVGMQDYFDLKRRCDALFELINVERFALKSRAQQAFVLALEPLAAAAAKEENVEAAATLSAAIEHVEQHTGNDQELESGLTADAEELQKKYQAELGRIHADGNRKSAQLALFFLKRIEALSVKATEAGDAEAMAFFENELRVHPGDALGGDAEATGMVGAGGGAHFLDLGPKDALLVGFRYWRGFYGNTIIKAIEPIYLTGEGKVPGARYGKPAGNELTVEAPEGYAVGGLEVRSGDRVDGFRAVFMKIKDDGKTLDREERAISPWCGGKNGNTRGYLGGTGAPVAGIFGRCGADLDALGLLQGKTPVTQAPGKK